MSETLFSAGALIIFLMFIVYMVAGTLIESKHWIVGHEAGVVIIIGMVLSFLALQFGHEEFNHMMTFDENFFFYFCLPPIVFASGYNMKRRKFFANITNILILGVFSTICQFIFFSIFTYILMETIPLTKFDTDTG
jgi:solute carrier family 9 (sodium/hydrogen exchanger), member 6/7